MNYNINALGEQEIQQIQVSFMKKVYSWMSVGLAITGVTAYYTLNSSLMNTVLDFFWFFIIAELGLVFLLSGMINRFSASTAGLMFLAYAILSGVTLSVVGLAYSGEDITNVFFITAGAFAGLSFYGFTTNKNLSGMGSFMIMGLFGIIIASVVNIFMANSALYFAISVIGVIVFAGLTAYDTQKLKEMALGVMEDQEMASKGAILGALALYLDFINLFLMLLRLLGNRD